MHQSVKESLENLGTDYIDSVLLHSPLPSHTETMTAWRILEDYVDSGQILSLGISNCYSLADFREVWQEARIKPRTLQNRFYRESGYDVDLREFCREQNIAYQSFWTLTANPHVIHDAKVVAIAERLKKTPEQIFFRFVMHLGITPLTGTTQTHHMHDDLDVLNFELSQHDVGTIEKLL